MRNAISITGAVLALAGTMTTHAAAQTRSQVYGRPLEQQAQTVFARADLGMTTFESEAAGSKETAGTTTLHVGGWAGEARSVGAVVSSTESTVPYSLNGAESRTAMRDVRFMARFGWVIPSVGMSLTEVDFKRDGEKTIGAIATGPNAGLAVSVPMTRAIVVTADGMVSQSTKTLDKLGGSTKVGARAEADVHASVDVTDRMVDLILGYKVRQFSIEDDGRKYQEQSQGAYAGVRLGLYF